MRRIFLLFPMAAAALHARAQSPTWADDVACVLYSHCTTCHHPGGAGHFSLLDYVNAYSYRNDIRDATQARFMPPWPPDEDYSTFAHERVLTQQEIDLIAAWVAGGAPQGDPGNAPTPPVYTTGTVITAPDISVRMEEYVIPASSSDIYRCFVMPTTESIDRFITGLEVIPGNTEVVHHVLVFQDTSGQAAVLDASDPLPGYTSFGGVGVNSAKLVGFWVPGSRPYFTPPGMGIKLLAGADLVMQVHYPAGSSFQLDSTRINLQLSPSTSLRNLAIDPVLNHSLSIIDGPLAIPPNQVKTFHAQYTVPVPATITAIGPHAHLLCVRMKSFAVKPGNDTVPLIDIPHWDFKWQGHYEFRNPIYLPAGTVLYGEATYDNTVNNPRNPNSPPQWVFVGEATTDEMMLFYFAWTIGVPADVLIVVDTSAHAAHHDDCQYTFPIGVNEGPAQAHARIWPVPATDVLQVEIDLPRAVLRLIDVQGRLVEEVRVVRGRNSVPLGRFARGAYTAEVRDEQGRPIHRGNVLLE